MTVSDILAEIRDRCGGNSNTEQLDNTTLLRRINYSYVKYVTKIQGMDGLWQFDDTNFTSFPIGTTTLVAGQRDYTFASDVLEVEQASVMNSAADYQVLTPIDLSQMGGIDPDELYQDDGLPNYYDKTGRTILLYPAPAAGSVTLALGLKVTFKRTADLYTSAQLTTGTKEPGFASPFHMLIPLDASLPFLNKYLPREVPAIKLEIQELEVDLKKHYSRREQDRRKRLTMGGINYL
mgnify:CR=1 FL=1